MTVADRNGAAARTTAVGGTTTVASPTRPPASRWSRNQATVRQLAGQGRAGPGGGSGTGTPSSALTAAASTCRTPGMDPVSSGGATATTTTARTDSGGQPMAPAASWLRGTITTR